MATRTGAGTPAWDDYPVWLHLIENDTGSAEDDARCFFKDRAESFLATARNAPISAPPKTHGERFWTLVLQANKDEPEAARHALVPYESTLELRQAAGQNIPTEKQKRDSTLKALAAFDPLVKWIGLACKPNANGMLYAFEGRRRFSQLFDAARQAFNDVIPRAADGAGLSKIASAMMGLRGTGLTHRDDTTIRLDASEFEKLKRGVELLRFDLAPTESRNAKLPNRRGRQVRRKTDRSVPTSKQTEAYSRHLKGESYAEIGKALGISATAAGKRVLAAKKILDRRPKSVSARRTLPKDHRGQTTISDEE